MKNKIPIKFMLSIILFGIIMSCQKGDEEKPYNSANDILFARTWFEGGYSHEIALKSEGFINGTVIGMPNWDLAFVNKHDDYKTIEIPLTLANEFGFATEESYQAAKETGDKRFTASRTTMVIETKGSKTIGFLMTIIPDKDYLVANDFEAFNSTYKKWQNGFSGYVLYHNLEGSFSNGWKLSAGNVINALNYAKGKEILTKSTSCYYYFFVLHITECGSDITKGTNGCKYYEEWYYMYDTCNGSGGGGDSGGGNGGYVAVEVPQETIYSNMIYSSTSSLSPAQKGRLEAALIGFINEYSISRTIWDALVSNGLLLKFEIGSTYNNAAAQIVGNTITFREENCITTSVIREELIHRYQGLIYGSAFGTYQNYELEAKVLQDLMFLEKNGYIMSQVGGFFTEDADLVSYWAWLQDIQLTGFIDQLIFNSFCSVWHYPGPLNGNVDYGFEPEVLHNLIQSTGIIY